MNSRRHEQARRAIQAIAGKKPVTVLMGGLTPTGQGASPNRNGAAISGRSTSGNGVSAS